MKRYWIIGAGRFGQKAAAELIRRRPPVELTLVDRRAEKLPQPPTAALHPVISDGVQFLADRLAAPTLPDCDWIIPAIPVHVAFEWVRHSLEDRFRLTKIPVPQDVLASLPNPAAGPDHRIFTSIAKFRCPDDCREPAKICSHTGNPRPCTLYRRIEKLGNRNLVVVVVRSRQLAPGVGGYRPADLFAALDSVIAAFGTPIVLATACRCHGVLDAFRLSPLC
jgi:hypothetical protein